MATWHVRPDASHGGTNAGTSYANAWRGWSSIVWGVGGVVGGDTLVVHGTITSGSNVSVGNHGASSASAPVTISGASEYEPGAIALTSAFYYPGRNYTETVDLTITRTGTLNAVVYTNANIHIAIRRCDISGGSAGISLDGTVAFNGVYIDDNYIHDIDGTYGASGRGISHLTTGTSLTHQKVFARRNTIRRCVDQGMRFSIESTAYTTSTYLDLLVEDNVVEGNGGGIWCRSGEADTTTPIIVFSTGLVIRQNTVRSNGQPAGGSVGVPGGISFSGWAGPKCYDNVVHDCYVQGAGIQTAKNNGASIFSNDIRRIRSGSPLSAYQSGLPIDGNGIFLDNLSNGCHAFGNYVEGLVSTGITNSGTAYSFWNCTNCTFSGNVAVDCYRGASYGDDVETGNKLLNNTFVGCDLGVAKIGTQVLTGNITVRNNIIDNCTDGFNIGANPGIDEDYSIVNVTGTAYSGISAGSNSQEADPLLTSDYRLTESSPCKGQGIYIAGACHMGGTRLSVVDPDIGAYRYFATRSVDSTRPVRRVG
jgi:parallel beta-helix repeat protein